MKLAVYLLTICMLIACSAPTGLVASDRAIPIGAVLPLTGIASIHGQNERQGIDLAVEEINAQGGVDGRPIVIIYEDD